MRTFLPTLLLVIAPVISLAAQKQPVKTPPSTTKPPAGKYLTAICTLQPGSASPCASLTSQEPRKTPENLKAQTITMKLDCEPTGTCTPAYPVKAGTKFKLKATSTSGLPVDVKPLSGEATISGSGSYDVTPQAPGKLVLEASQEALETGGSKYAKAQRVRLSLDVVDSDADPQSEAVTCARLFPPSTTPVAVSSLDAPTMVSLLGDPKPLTLVAQGKATILIYSTVTPVPDQALKDIEASIKTLLNRSATDFGIIPANPFSVELFIPHAAALGDLATKFSGLSYQQFKIEDVGTDRVRISAPSQPDCKVWSAFLSDVQHASWQLTSEPPDMKLFYLNSSDVSTAFGTVAGSSGGSGAGAGGTSGTGGTGAAGSGSGSGGGSGAAGGASGASGSGSAGSGGAASPTPAAGAPANTATISITQPPGSTIDFESTTGDCSAGGTTGGSSGCAGSNPSGAESSAGQASSASASPAAAHTPTAAPKPATSLAGIGQDLLLFSDATPGDDAAIVEKKRVLAMLDLPRPEMIINAWVMQNSTTDPVAMGGFNNIVHRIVTNNNDALQLAVLRGWNVVKDQISHPENVDKFFYKYVSGRYIAEPMVQPAPQTADQAAQQALDLTQPSSPLDPVRKQLGLCEENRYCLGYANIFQPLKPRLTDLLLAVIAAKDPVALVEAAVTEMQKPIGSTSADMDFQKQMTKALNLKDIGQDKETQQDNCEVKDLRQMQAATPGRGRAPLQLQCFQASARLLLAPSPSPSPLGLMRAAIADFLFNYKLSQQYPHQFAPYDLSQSADALNSALSPLIDAFNRDISAYQTYLRAELSIEVNEFNAQHDHRVIKRIFGSDKPSFFNDGLVTVRTISGKYTTVDTASQSFLDASTAPQLSDLANAITGATPPGGTSNLTAKGKLAPNILDNLSFNEAQVLIGALKSYQTTQAQIGRGLTVDAIPRSLNGASSAEIDVTLNADESAAPTYYGGMHAGSDLNLSRVAKHDTSTRVRVESIKLFEVSSFSAILQRSRPRFPLIPPFVELPYIGTIAGIPLPAAKEYHNSTAILSAIVVPTAADLAYGLTFQSDRVVDPSRACQWPTTLEQKIEQPAKPFCQLRRALSLSDIDKQPIRNFHKAVIHCLSTDMIAPNSSLEGIPAEHACENLVFGKVLHDAN